MNILRTYKSVVIIFLFCSGLTQAEEKEPLLTPSDAIYIMENLLRESYGFKLPALKDGSMHSSYYYAQLLEEKIRNSIKNKSNSKNISLYFLNTYSEYMRESHHGNFKGNIYNIFKINPKMFLTVLSSKYNRFMFKGICSSLGENYESIENPEMKEQGPKIKFNELYKKDMMALKEKDRDACLKLVNQ